MEWVCQVCGYIHDGDEPPADGCLVCGAPASQFVRMNDDDQSDASEED